MRLRLGVISDTHGLLRAEAVAALGGVDQILHAGDVGDPAILVELERIAPVTAIRGNVDTEGPCSRLPATETVELGGCLIHMVHSVAWLEVHPHAAGVGLVISGHSHQPVIRSEKGVLYLNPGSAGPRRFQLPVSVARVEIVDGRPRAELIELAV